MAVTSFIPEIWNASLLTNFRERALAAGLANTEYSGNATSGNIVKINGMTDVTIKDYKAGVVSDGDAGTLPRTTAPDGITTASQDLLIDQEKSFDFLVDDIDRAQVAGSLDAFTRSAGLAMAEDADKFLFSTAVTAANAGNTEAGAALTTGDAAWNLIRDIRKALNKNHVPQDQRVLVVNAEFEALLLGADAKLTSADTAGTTEGMRSAALGRILGFDVYTSENLPTTAKQQVLAFYRPALAYVSQVEKTEAMRAETSFSDRLRGLHVYGGKVIRPTSVAVWTAN